jgi:hypothetical protein
MKHSSLLFAAALAGGLAVAGSTRADTLITDFHNFSSDALYAGWGSGTVVSGPTNYMITASGYGSNWKYLPVQASTTDTNIELTITLSGPGGDGFLGPIVTLVDTTGREYNFAWYGQNRGHLVLTKPISSPNWTSGPAGALDLAHLNGIHMQLDPSSYSGSYTLSWEKLRVVGPPSSTAPIKITSQTFNPATGDFTLTWTSDVGQYYTVLYTPDLSTAMSPLTVNVSSGGTTTTTTVNLPSGNAGFLKIKKQ